MDNERRNYPSSSGLHRIEQCRVSWLRERDMKQSALGESWRAEGEMLHEATLELSEEELEGISTDHEILIQRANRCRQTAIQRFAFDGDTKRVTERRLWVRNQKLKPVYSGRFDEFIFQTNGKRGLVIDLKYGRKAVPRADINTQLRSYAVAIDRCVEFRNYDFEEIGVAIVQPHMRFDRMLSMAVFDRDTLDAAYTGLIQMIEEAQNPEDLAAQPNYHACEYCKAIHVCQEAWKFFTTVQITL